MKNRIGIIGGGQLARMMAFEAKRLGFMITVLDPTPKSPGGQVADKQIVADFNDEKAIKELAKEVDYLTFEVEFAKPEVLTQLAKQGIKINPNAKTSAIINDKYGQKVFLKKSGIPIADFIKVETEEDVVKAVQKFGYPLLLKSRFDAFDGRGNVVIKNVKDIKEGLEKLKGKSLYIEQFVRFSKELAVMVARSTKGEIAVYPVVETVHENNICTLVLAPALINPKIQKKAQRLASKTMEYLKGAGVFGIEMFLTKDGKILINELAPRVHNSGHYTIEGCITSQFEQHIRAITGMPLGSTKMVMPAAVMINILGQRKGPADVNYLDRALGITNVAVHIYGKHETKLERKMGHITVIDSSIAKALKKAKLARAHLTI